MLWSSLWIRSRRSLWQKPDCLSFLLKILLLFLWNLPTLGLLFLLIYCMFRYSYNKIFWRPWNCCQNDQKMLVLTGNFLKNAGGERVKSLQYCYYYYYYLKDWSKKKKHVSNSFVWNFHTVFSTTLFSCGQFSQLLLMVQQFEENHSEQVS